VEDKEKAGGERGFEGIIAEQKKLPEKHASWPEYSVLLLKLEHFAKHQLKLKEKNLEYKSTKLKGIKRAGSELSQSS